MPLSHKFSEGSMSCTKDGETSRFTNRATVVRPYDARDLGKRSNALPAYATTNT